jgi:hypothetical protein
MSRLSVFLAAVLLAGPARAAAPRPVVLELFTSQSCSSCPPADRLLADLAATRTDILPLDFHVDYWNYLSWRDRFSLPEATARQRAAAASLGSEVYTPQLVVNGQFQAVGSDRAAVLAAIAQAQAAQSAGPDLALTRSGAGLALSIGAGGQKGTVWLVGFDPMHVTEVGSGENTGRTLTEVNVVRSISNVLAYNGAQSSLTLPVPAGDRYAVLLQSPGGAILAAATPPGG